MSKDERFHLVANIPYPGMSLSEFHEMAEWFGLEVIEKKRFETVFYECGVVARYRREGDYTRHMKHHAAQGLALYAENHGLITHTFGETRWFDGIQELRSLATFIRPIHKSKLN